MVGIIRHEVLSSRDVVDIGQSRYSSSWALHNGHIQVSGLTIAHSLCHSPLLSLSLSLSLSPLLPASDAAPWDNPPCSFACISGEELSLSLSLSLKLM